MPSTSKSQQRLMGMSYAVKKGDMAISDIDTSYRDEVKNLVDTMTLKELKDFASTQHKGLPESNKIDEALKMIMNPLMHQVMKAFSFNRDPDIKAELRAAIQAAIEPILRQHDITVEGEDHEVGMALGQLVAIHTAVDELEDKIGTDEKDLPKGVGYDKIKGGLADDLTVDDIAKKHKVSSDVIELAIKQGIDVESEHTSDATVAYEIAKDHIFEDPKYYDKLKKIEASGDVKETTSMPGSLGNVMNTMLRGMGDVSLPNGNALGSGDVPAGAGKAKKKKKLLKIEDFLQEQEQLKAFKPTQGKDEELGSGDYEQGPANEPEVEMAQRARSHKMARNVVTFDTYITQ